MSNKVERQFLKLRKAHSDAISAREAAAKATLAVLTGQSELREALSSKAGAKALGAEIVALKDERRALKRLAAFVARHPAPPPGRSDAKAAAPTKAKSDESVPAKKARKKTAAERSRQTASA